jgi:5-methylcytosine-specific restriction protein A
MPARIPTHKPPCFGQSDRGYEGSTVRLADKRFYAGIRWLNLRAAFLRENPLCVDCRKAGRLTPAEHVHHVLERKARPDLAYEWSNLEAACPSCHNAKRKHRD